MQASSADDMFGPEPSYEKQPEDRASWLLGTFFHTWLGDLMHRAAREELTMEGLPRPMRDYRAYNAGVALSAELQRQQARRHAWDGHVGARVAVRWDAASDGVLRWVGVVQQYGTPRQLYAGVEWRVAPTRRRDGCLRRALGWLACGAAAGAVPERGPGAYHRGEVDGEHLFDAAEDDTVATCERVEDVVFLPLSEVVGSSALGEVSESSYGSVNLSADGAARKTPCAPPHLRPPQQVSTTWALLWCFRWRLLALGPLRFIIEGTAVLGPMALRWYISFLRTSSHGHAPQTATGAAETAEGAVVSSTPVDAASTDVVTPLTSVFLLFALSLLHSLALQKYNQLVGRSAFSAQVGLVTCVAAKCLRISPKELQRPELNVGRVVNFLATDVVSVENVFQVAWMTVTVPLQLCTALYFLFTSMGAAAGISVLMLLLALPLQILLTHYTYKFTLRMTQATDARLRTVNEFLAGIRSIKMMGMEETVVEELNHRRRVELRALRSYQLIFISNALLARCIPACTTAGVMVAYIRAGNPMTPAVIYPALSLLGLMESPFRLVTYLISVYSQFFVSMRRLTAFLAADDAQARDILEDTPAAHDGSARAGPDAAATAAAVFVDATISSYKPVPLPAPEGRSVAGSGRSGSGSGGSGGDAADTHYVLRAKTLLADVDVRVPRGRLTVVLGPTGSGKSTLLDALIGALAVTRGRVACERGVAYVPQQPWIMNATLRDNVVFFGAPDAAALERALRSSQLAADLALLADGADTEIGERGINLSGGQKARVSLARAVYADRDVYVLDDPLSALDAHVGERVMRECVCGALAGKTRVLATHQVHVARDADHVVVLAADGRIAFQGTREEYYQDHLARQLSEHGDGGAAPAAAQSGAAASQPPLAEVSPSQKLSDLMFDEQTTTTDGTSAAASDGGAPPAEEKGKLLTEEERFKGAVEWAVYVRYMQACGGVCVCVAVMALYLATEAIMMSPSIWLALWSTTWLPLSATQYSFIYIGLSFISALTRPVRYWVSMTVMRRASRVVHSDLLRSVACATLQFFDTTPLGRIVNRFTNDISNVDSDLQGSYSFLLSTISEFFSTVAMMIATQIFVLGILVPCMVAYYFLLKFYARANREIKRLVNRVNSPVLTVLQEAISGRWTVQAYGAAPAVIQKALRCADVVYTCSYLQLGAELWLSVRIQLLSTLITVTVALGAVAAMHVSFLPSHIGLLSLSLTLALEISGLLDGIVTVLASVEADMNSIERVFHMTDSIEHEQLQDDVAAEVHRITTAAAAAAAATASAQTPAPADADDDIDDTATTALTNSSSPHLIRERGDTEFGSLVLEHVDMRYRAGLPLVLRDVCFAVAPGQKVGVVGRTGSGKSTLLLAFLRLVEVCGGRMLVCGRDARGYGVRELRRLFSMIPQDPLLFDGTVRSNVDPFARCGDAAVWRALRQVGMEERVRGDAGGLDGRVQEGGANYSVGQRQLLCLARALLKRGSAFLLMDEATANVDPALDRHIQRTVQHTFRHHTVVTIAHRLHTVAAYDAVLVMDQGRAIEFGAPADLVQRTGSAFGALVRSMGSGAQQAFRVALEEKRVASGKLHV